MKKISARFLLFSFIIALILIPSALLLIFERQKNIPVEPKPSVVHSPYLSPFLGEGFLLPDGNIASLGYKFMSNDKMFAFIVGKLVQVWDENDNAYASITLNTLQNSKPQAFLLYDSKENLIFDLQKQQTQDFFPLSKVYTSDIMKNDKDIVSALKNFQDKLIILSLQISQIPPRPGQEQTFSILNTHSACNKVWFSNLESKNDTASQCIPYVYKLAIYEK